MLTKAQRALLHNVLDALDRLFDSQSTATDVKAILVATEAALSMTRLAPPVSSALQELNRLVKATDAREDRRNAALVATDTLRTFVAEELAKDGRDNPRRRWPT